MSIIKVNDKNFQPYLSAAALHGRIKELATEINKEYQGKRPLFIAILNGSFMFASDLFKEITIDAEICFIKLASYKGTRSTGNVITSIGLDEPLKDRHVVIIEDIVDTGNTLVELKELFKQQNVKHFKIATLFFKPEAYTKDIKIDYVGIRIPNKFIVGYGLDYDGLGRNLPEVYQLKD